MDNAASPQGFYILLLVPVANRGMMNFAKWL